MPEATDAVELHRVDGRLEFDHVWFRYVRGAPPALRDVSFATEPGQTVALLGSTGSGKSSLIGLIPRFYDVSDGAIRLDGVDIRSLKIESLRRQISIVLQDPKLLGGPSSTTSVTAGRTRRPRRWKRLREPPPRTRS